MKISAFPATLLATLFALFSTSCEHDTDFDIAQVRANAVAQIYIEQDKNLVDSYEILGNTMLSFCNYQSDYPQPGVTDGWVVGESSQRNSLHIRYNGDSCDTRDPAKDEAAITIYLRDGSPLSMIDGQVSPIRHEYSAQAQTFRTVGRFYGHFKASDGEAFEVTGKWMIESAN